MGIHKMSRPKAVRTDSTERIARHNHAPRLAAATAIGLIATAGTANAQTPSPLAEWQYSAGVLLERLFEPQRPAWQIEVGPGATVQPLYDGARRYHVMPGPSIDIRYRDLFFASTGEGVGVNLLDGPNWRAGIAISYDLGRRAADDSAHLSGLGNIGIAPEVKLFGEYVVSKDLPIVMRADVRRSIGGSNGWIGDLGVYMLLPGSSETFFWFAGPSVTFADGRYMSSWFGVNPAQSAQSGYRTYGTHAGLKSVGFGLSAIWNFRQHWYLSADAAIEQLTGSAARSPITQHATNGVFNLSIDYEF
jgi:outer membrane scaffolding protein for murein synthesis (MipA/OmpV family)